MKCRNCGTENPVHANFCNECGAKLRPAISLKKDDLPPAFVDRTYIRDSDRPVPVPESVAESSAPPVEPAQTPPSTSTPVFSPSSTSNHNSADLPRSAFREPPVIGSNAAVAEPLPNLQLRWEGGGDEDEPPGPWYESTWGCIAALFLFFPLGVFLLWKFHKNWGPLCNAAITFGFAVVSLPLALTLFGLITTVYPKDLEILNPDYLMNINDTAYVDFRIEPKDASPSRIYLYSADEEVVVFEQIIDDGKLRGKLTAVGGGTSTISLCADGVPGNTVSVTVVDPEEDKQEAQNFSMRVQRIGEVTPDKAAKIKGLIKEYDALPGRIKELVPNAEALMEANRALELLQKEEAERLEQMILDAEAAIEQIGEVTLDKRDLIAEARQQVNAIPWERRKNMVNYDKLKAAEDTIEDLQVKKHILEQSKPITPAFYSQYLRNPDVYQGRFTSFRCKVFQIANETKAANFYLAHLYDENGPTDMVFYFIYTLQDQPRILEGDIVTIYGSYNGVVQYFTSETTTASVPQVRVRLLETE